MFKENCLIVHYLKQKSKAFSELKLKRKVREVYFT